MGEDARARLDQLNFVVRDMDAMVAFYERLGVQVQVGPPEWQPHHRNSEVEDGLHIDFDSSRFATVWNSSWAEGRTGVVIGFRVPSREAVDRLFAELTAAGYAGEQEPWDTFWGARYAIVSDPDGNSVGLMSPIDRSRSTPSPDPPS